MKKFLLLPLCVLLIYAETIASPHLPRAAGLEISCRLSEKELPVKDYLILVYEDSVFKDSVFVELDLPVYLQLELNRRYCLKFSKAGFLDRVVLFETSVPKGKEKRRFSYEFEIEMLPGESKPNTAGDLPVALIHYDTLQGAFGHSSQYAASIGHFPEIAVIAKKEKRVSEAPAKKRKGVVRKGL